MSTLAKAHRVKLAKLLAMFSSDHAGERDAAACAAQRLIQQHGVTWREVLEPAAPGHKLPELGTWRQTAARCLEHPGSLRAWERGFLIDLPKFQRLSTKQRYVLKEIADRVLGQVRS